MIGILVVSHGKLATGLLSSAELILGRLEAVAAVELDEGTAQNTLRSRVDERISRLLDEEGILILTDLRGATPCNVTAELAERDTISVVTGVNLPLLIHALTERGCQDLGQLTASAIEAGRAGIVDMAELIGQYRTAERDGNCGNPREQF